jgi:hydrogenase maturation protein HypF
MCPACQAEYDNPQDRRFHAQPNACPVCGPQLEFRDAISGALTPAKLGHRHRYEALLAAADALRAGQIVAVKGIGGFHLLVDARNEAAVRRLRERKHREEKPFALLFPNLESARQICEISPPEERLLCSPEAPIVLLARNRQSAIGNRQSTLRSAATEDGSAISPAVAPANPNLGLMLPSNPIHQLLMAELGFPVVATSGNLSDEPICTDESDAAERLRGIADAFLIHDRPIVRHVDDSIARVVLGREMILRRARGYAPLPISISAAAKAGLGEGAAGKIILAVGAHLKNAVALSVGGNVFVSQHIGDLETPQAEDAFRRVAADLQKLYEVKAGVYAADLHPDYLSTRFALQQCLGADPQTGAPRLVQVQHHIAHALSCIAENEIQLPALGIAWDGTGYGTDGTIWGGEFFLVKSGSAERVASLRPFPLPGGDAAIKEPRRSALGMLFEMTGDAIFLRNDCPAVAAFSPGELSLLKTMLNRGLNSPKTSSMGRCFDAVAAIAGLCQRMQFEGQAAMELEFAAAGVETDKRYELPFVEREGTCLLDWAPAIREILSDARKGIAIAEISARFHNALAEVIVEAARRFGQARVALSGGCFQNRRLLERAVNRLRAEGMQPYWHQRVPTNDGGIALGQVLAAVRVMV